MRGKTLGLRLSAIAFLIGAALLPQSPRPAAELQPEPNFVVIVSDDQRWNTVGRCFNGYDDTDLAAGADACMPGLQERLIAAGTTFQRGYVTTSLCCPSRASILTGRYAHRIPVLETNGFKKFGDSSTLATWLHDSGYRTGLIGKYLNGYGLSGTATNYVPPGWDWWHSFWGTPGYSTYSLVEFDPGTPAGLISYRDADSTSTAACAEGNLYSTDLLCRRSLEFLAADAAAPFFLYLAPYSPHTPFTPAKRWKGFHDGVDVPLYPSFDAVPSPNPPSWLRDTPLTAQEVNGIRRTLRAQLDTNRAVDDAIQAIHDQLTADGRLDETVWVFISDNSVSAGEHRYTGKSCEYDDCHLVPIVIACPAAICPGATPGSVDGEHFALNIDLAPTIAELAGVQAPGNVDGSSLIPLLTGTASQWRSSFFMRDSVNVNSKAVMTRWTDGHQYKYVELGTSPEREMYDLTADRWELANLIDDGVHADVQQALAGMLVQEFGANVTVTLAGAGKGSVTSTPKGINCPSKCSVPFLYGSSVTLKARPSLGNVFTGWAGDCTGTGDCTLTADRHLAVTATFEPA